ncbi:uncharacterized protein LOC106152481 isoform X2 [Lingula anatina]|uniref:Uncharacterized protein LOC106152481 isoform X2 n=1 Tax=Lingula anatina TaxID=7574 RepID=A0A1S3H6B8_LINAN|nr:uncharacterized protein LOC106152481 isoform X2 [Lingula anatina]|eukprot:XP_013381543.1 uncharacterized protein LOC106152481 isoform X2 [Lingula anatina]
MVFSDQNNSRSGVQMRKSRSQGLRYLGLDLSYEDRQRQFASDANIGQGFKGSKRHPPSQYSFNHSAEYHRELQDDINHIMEDEFTAEHGTPKYVMDISNQVSHSGESPLFLSKLLPANKLEQRNGPIKWHKALLQPNKCAPPLKQNGQTFYRPNSTHQYLTTTELKNSAMNEVNVQLGKPTRASLLRARHRCSSAPVNAYEQRRQTPRVPPVSRPQSASSGIRRAPQPQVPAGESVHSFLIGARYNNAHYLDSKSLFKFGVYMPRSNPGQTFFVEKIRKTIEMKDAEGNIVDHVDDQYGSDQHTPGTPQESTCSDSDEENTPGSGSGHASVSATTFPEASATYPPVYERHARNHGHPQTEAGHLSSRHDSFPPPPPHPHHLSRPTPATSTPNIPRSMQDSRKRPSSARDNSKKNLFLFDLPKDIRLKGVKVSGAQLKGAKYQKAPVPLSTHNPLMNSIEVQGVQASVWSPNAVTARPVNTPRQTTKTPGVTTEQNVAALQEKPESAADGKSQSQEDLAIPSTLVEEDNTGLAEESATARGNSMLDYSSVTGGVNANDIGNDLDDLDELIEEVDEANKSQDEQVDPANQVIPEQATEPKDDLNNEVSLKEDSHQHESENRAVEGAGDAHIEDRSIPMAVEGVVGREQDETNTGLLMADQDGVTSKEGEMETGENQMTVDPNQQDSVLFFVTEEEDENKNKETLNTADGTGEPDSSPVVSQQDNDLAHLNQNNNNNNDSVHQVKQSSRRAEASLTIDIDLLTLEELTNT